MPLQSYLVQSLFLKIFPSLFHSLETAQSPGGRGEGQRVPAHWVREGPKPSSFQQKGQQRQSAWHFGTPSLSHHHGAVTVLQRPVL